MNTRIMSVCLLISESSREVKLYEWTLYDFLYKNIILNIILV